MKHPWVFHGSAPEGRGHLLLLERAAGGPYPHEGRRDGYERCHRDGAAGGAGRSAAGGWAPARAPAREEEDGEGNQGRSRSAVSCQGGPGGGEGLGQDRSLLPVLSRLSLLFLWSTSTVPTR